MVSPKLGFYLFNSYKKCSHLLGLDIMDKIKILFHQGFCADNHSIFVSTIVQFVCRQLFNFSTIYKGLSKSRMFSRFSKKKKLISEDGRTLLFVHQHLRDFYFNLSRPSKSNLLSHCWVSTVDRISPLPTSTVRRGTGGSRWCLFSKSILVPDYK